MLTIEEMRARASKLIDEALEIARNASTEGCLTDEQRAEIDAKEKEAASLTSTAETQERLALRAAELNKPNERTREPEMPVVTSPKEEEFRHNGEFLQAVARAGMPNAMHDRRLDARAATGMGGDIDSDGGFLAGVEYAEELLGRSYGESKFASLCQKTTIGQGKASLVVNAFNETSRANGSRAGGIRAYWEGEGDEITATKPKFRQMEWKPKKLVALAYITDELLDDARALKTEVDQGYVDEFAFKLDDAILNGSGAGQPAGILTAAALVSITKEGGQAADTILWENVQKIFVRVHPGSIGKAKWITNQDCLLQLMSMYKVIGTGGVPVYLPAGGASEQPYGTLMGLPIIVAEQAPGVGDAGCLTLADFSQYKLVDKEGGIDTAASMHVRFIYGEMCFRWTTRIDGASIWHSKLTPYKGTGSTVSPFVTMPEVA